VVAPMKSMEKSLFMVKEGVIYLKLNGIAEGFKVIYGRSPLNFHTGQIRVKIHVVIALPLCL
jgi:hypothetical protein